MAMHRTADALVPGDAVGVSTFADSLFGHLRRADQRRWAEAYLQALLTTAGKKSVRRLAATISHSPTAAHSLQQFINASPWDWNPARHELLRLVDQRVAARAWTIGLAVLPKRGNHSVGVHRCFVGTAGKVLNCQLGLGIFVSGRDQDIPVDWQLLLPDEWAQDAQQRQRARIPDSTRHQPLWAHALDLVDTMSARTSQASAPVVADMSECPDVGMLLSGLLKRRRDFVIAVPRDLQVVPDAGRTASPARHLSGSQGASGAEQLMQQSSALHPHISTLSSLGPHQRVRVVSALVQLTAAGMSHGTARPPLRLFTERQTGRRGTRVWITSLLDRRVEDVWELSRLHGRTNQAVDSLREEYGLLDFEGRSFPGWHHHMTLASAAFAYRRLVQAVALPPALPAAARHAEAPHRAHALV